METDLKNLGRDKRAVVTIEFALWTSMIFLTLLPVLDMGAYLIAGNRISGLVQQASILAFNMRDAETMDTSKLSNYVAASMPSNASVSVVCNGGVTPCSAAKAERQCACTSATAPFYTKTASCGQSCTGGATSGYYVTVGAGYTYRATVVPNRLLDGERLSKAVTVRLQ